MGSFISSAGLLLVSALFGALLLILLLRLALPLTRVRFNNPICQFVYKSTNPVVGPLAQLLPPIKQFSLATAALMLLTVLIELVLIMLLLRMPLHAGVLALFTLTGLVYYIIGVAFWTILISAVMSFFSPNPRNPAVEVIASLSEPLLRPFRKLPPHSAPLDLSPLYATLALRLLMLAMFHAFGSAGTLFLAF